MDEGTGLLDGSFRFQLHSNEVVNETISSESVDSHTAKEVIIDDVIHAIQAFYATARPVAVCMILSALSVVYIKSDVLGTNNDLNVYKINDDTSTTNSVKFEESLVNALVMVSFVCISTFIVVILLYYRCTTFIYGYLMLSSTLLLSLIGGLYFIAILQIFNIPMDIFTFFFILFNFSVVGVKAIYFPEGIPMIVTQSYLICVSVLLTWNLSRFDEWTTWSLLGVLAVYDFFAVLSPFGPLRCLVNIMKNRRSVELPGMLYEAHLDPQESHISPERRIFVEIPQFRNMEDTFDDSIEPSIHRVKENERNDDQRSIESESESGVTNSQHRLESQQSNLERESNYKRSVKLGLGDFVFYSVLISQAASDSFAAACSCFIAVLGGLALTMFLLATYKTALPALPISIFLGIGSFMMMRHVVTPTANLVFADGYII